MRIAWIALLWAIVLAGSWALFRADDLRAWARSKGVTGQRTVSQVLDRFGPAVRRKFEPIARRAGAPWPPKSITLLAFKTERILEVWAKDGDGKQKKLAAYKILAASGDLGPKRKEGDKQVPEGFYKLTTLNPNSAYHLSVKVDYPNAEDVTNKKVPRSEMGGDIFVHGNQLSIGCIAIGDDAIEEVFCLAAWAKNREIIISPIDFRADRMARLPTGPWITELYGRLAKRLQDF